MMDTRPDEIASRRDSPAVCARASGSWFRVRGLGLSVEDLAIVQVMRELPSRGDAPTVGIRVEGVRGYVRGSRVWCTGSRVRVEGYAELWPQLWPRRHSRAPARCTDSFCTLSLWQGFLFDGLHPQSVADCGTKQKSTWQTVAAVADCTRSLWQGFLFRA